MTERTTSIEPAPGDVWQDDGARGAAARPWQAIGGAGASNGLQNFIAVVLKRRWLILGITLAALVIALLFTVFSSPVYIARATFQVQREAPRVVDTQGASTAPSTESDQAFLNTQFALITSRVNAQGIVRRLNLATNRDFIGGGALGGIFQNDGTPSPAALQQAFDAATAKVMQNLTATQYGTSLLIHTLIGNLLTPWLTSRASRMNPVAVFVGLLAWGWLWGVWGLLLGIPILMIVKAICDRVEDLKPIGEFLGS